MLKRILKIVGSIMTIMGVLFTIMIVISITEMPELVDPY